VLCRPSFSSALSILAFPSNSSALPASIKNLSMLQNKKNQ
jgi:hypothetical protein